MNLSEQVHAIAVHLGKSENMRIAAGQMFDKAWEYIKTPGTDGAKQLSDAGLPITQKALWSMIVYNPSFPAQIGSSWRTGRRVLAIAQSPDPEEADKKIRTAQAEANARRVSHKSQKEKNEQLHNRPSEGQKCNNPSVTNDTGGAQAPSHPQPEQSKTETASRPEETESTASAGPINTRADDIADFLYVCLMDDKLRKLSEMLEGVCDPLSRAIVRRVELEWEQ